jgi:hypothetical protein
MISRSIYNLNIDTVYTYHIPIERTFLQLSSSRYKTCNAIYWQKARIKSERHRWLRPSHSRLCINRPSELGRLTGGCVCQWVK